MIIADKYGRNQVNRPVIIACSKMRNVNLSSIARAASGSGIHQIIGLGFKGKVKSYVARDATVEVKNRSATYLKKLRADGYRIVAIEQTRSSVRLPEYKFHRKTVLVLGNENTGVAQAVLQLCDDVVEIPMYGYPTCHNVAVAAAISIYEYCRQYSLGLND